MSKRKFQIMIIGVVVCFLMIAIETIIKPVYFVKSTFKLFLFGGSVIAYGKINNISLTELLNIQKPQNAKSLYAFMVLSYFAVIISFFVFKGHIDIESIRANLIAKEGLTKQNCIFVFMYIMFVNSFLEEAFFRGFIFNGLNAEKSTAYIMSSVLFSVYHIGIVEGWFSPIILMVCISGLMVAGIVLDYVCERYNSLLASYTVHAVANFAINSVGIYLMFIM